jgi:hypothetical protein
MLIWFWIGSRKRNPNPKIKDWGEADLPGSLSPLSPPPSCGKKHPSHWSVRSRHRVAFASGLGSRAPLRGHSTAYRVALAARVRRRGVPPQRHHHSSIMRRRRFTDDHSGCEREGARRKWIRVQGRAAARVFVPLKSPYSRRIRWTAEIHWARSGLGRIELSRPRPRLWPGHGGGAMRRAWVGRPASPSRGQRLSGPLGRTGGAGALGRLDGPRRNAGPSTANAVVAGLRTAAAARPRV